MILLAWTEFTKRAEPQQLKKKESKRGGLLRLFSMKTDPVETYIRAIMEANGFSFEQAKVPLFKIAETINFPTAFFSVERLIVREQLQKGDSPFGGF